MALSKRLTDELRWILRRPLQIEFLRKDLPESDDTERLLKELQSQRENLDAVVYALSSRNLAADRREHLVEMLRRHQRALEACFRKLGVEVPGQGRAPLWYFNQLDPSARSHLASILGVPEEPPFYEVLDIKAEEYLAQQSAFQALADHCGFKERDSVGRNAKRALLLLTLSGSLVQLSEPMSSKGDRRYLYQNIYGNAHPPEGVLVLDRGVRVGHRLRSVELTTSPLRLLRVVGRRMSWRAQSQTFERISRTLTSLVSQSNSRIAAAGGPLAPQATGLHRQANLRAAERVLASEYGTAFERFRELRTRFVEGDGSGEEARRDEAELLTVCLYLQTAARELGFGARALPDLRDFTTEGRHVYRTDPKRPNMVVMIPGGKGPEVELVDVSVGRQTVTCRAPLALIGKDGGLMEVTLPVERIRRR